MPEPKSPNSQAVGDLFLPSFCEPRLLLSVLIIGQLLAFLLTLASARGEELWANLGLITLFTQWVALCSAATLCLLRKPLARLSNAAAAALSYLALLLVTLGLSELAWRLVLPSGLFSIGPLGDEAGFVLRNLLISAVVSGLLLRYFYVQHQWRRQVRAEASARADALAARIRPHFLFNSLNTIAELTASAPERAEEAVLDLADLYRASLADVGRRISLAEEIEVAKRYLNMESLRLGERLQVSWELEARQLDSIRVPALILQPLLENAVYHGVEALPEGGRIRVHVAVTDECLLLEIENPLPPQAQRALPGNRMAQDNIRERLALAYGEAARFDTEEDHGCYRIRMRLPRQTK